ncbi:MAG: hypothetical protein F6K16_41030 [Symploca sp. SIO2B6]|nr:hypothetical protein [Symploca sp. SIO2B6]
MNLATAVAAGFFFKPRLSVSTVHPYFSSWRDRYKATSRFALELVRRFHG